MNVYFKEHVNVCQQTILIHGGDFLTVSPLKDNEFCNQCFGKDSHEGCYNCLRLYLIKKEAETKETGQPDSGEQQRPTENPQLMQGTQTQLLLYSSF